MTDRDDVLTRAAGALRAVETPSGEELRRLRERVLSGPKGTGMHERRWRVLGARRVRWVLPLAAAFVAASAFAATPEAWSELKRAVERYLPFAQHVPASVSPSPHPPARAPSTLRETVSSERVAEPRQSEPTATVVPSASALTSESSAAHAPTRETSAVSSPERPRALPPRRRAPAANAEQNPPESAVPAGTEPMQTEREDVRRFREAYALHYRAHDYVRALSAWDGYLALASEGALAVEARYNRALCLIRLARFAEARTALSPFAVSAAYDGYKRQEAARLLKALEDRP